MMLLSFSRFVRWAPTLATRLLLAAMLVVSTGGTVAFERSESAEKTDASGDASETKDADGKPEAWRRSRRRAEPPPMLLTPLRSRLSCAAARSVATPRSSITDPSTCRPPLPRLMI